MSQNVDEELSQPIEPIDPPLTLAQQVRGTIALTRLVLEVIRLVFAIIKLLKAYRSSASRPMPETDASLGGDSAEIEPIVAEQPL